MRVIIGTALAVAALTGCQPQPYYAAPVQQAPQPVVAQTCIGANNIVVADQYCDPNYIAQKRAYAQQSNNTQLLTDLLLYHAIFSSNPYNVGQTFIYTPGSYYTSRPSGYAIQSRSTYVTNVHNHTIVVNNGKASIPSPTRSGTSTSSATAASGGRVRTPTSSASSWSSSRSTPSTSRSYSSSATASSSRSSSSSGGRRSR